MSAGTPEVFPSSGAEALAAGAAAAGCRFFGSREGDALAGLTAAVEASALDRGMAVFRAEDEPAALSAALGAGHAGARAMAACSCAGLATAEGLVAFSSLAEVPAVLVCVREGPGDARPYRLLSRNIPAAVLVPDSVADCFQSAVEAFALADAFQCPVLLVCDRRLLERTESVPMPPPPASIDRGRWALPPETGAFRRYADSEDGASPRSVPGQEGLLFVADPDPVGRTAKLERKAASLRAALRPCRLEGPSDAETVFVSWGAVSGLLRRALGSLEAEGARPASLLSLRAFSPFRGEEVRGLLSGAKAVLCVEEGGGDGLSGSLRAGAGVDAAPSSIEVSGAFDEAVLRAGLRKALHG